MCTKNAQVKGDTILKPGESETSKSGLAHLQYMINYCTNFQKNHRKTEGGVCITKLLNLKYVYNQNILFSFNRQKMVSKVYMNVIFAITAYLLAINHVELSRCFTARK